MSARRYETPITKQEIDRSSISDLPFVQREKHRHNIIRIYPKISAVKQKINKNRTFLQEAIGEKRTEKFDLEFEGHRT